MTIDEAMKKCEEIIHSIGGDNERRDNSYNYLG
jgi:hypothetical protein